MRSAALAFVAGLAWSSVANAAPVEPRPIAPKPVETPEPAPEPGKPKPVQPKPAPREPAPEPPKQPSPPLADPRPTEPKPGEPRPTEPKPTAAPRIDLTPSHLFGPKGTLPGAAAKNAKPPEHRGATLGDDTSWKVQAAQVGVMVGAFGVLSVLCGNGRCAEALSDVVPGGKPDQGPQVDVNRGSGSSVRDAR